MGSKVVVTYKRKRLFSRIDHSLISLHSDRSCESAKSKTTDTFPKQEGPIAESTLQNNDTGIETYAYSKDDVGGDAQQCENCKSHCCRQCSEKLSRKPEMALTEQKDSSVSQPPDACSGAKPDPICLKTSAGMNGSCHTNGLCTSEASYLEAKDILNTDQYGGLCNNSGIKRKLTSTLITFCRRSKRNRENVAVNSATLPTANCLVDLKNDKELPEDGDHSCSFSALAPATSMVVPADTCQHFPPGEGAQAPNATAHRCEDSQEQMLHKRVGTDAQDNHNINVTTENLKEDAKSGRIQSDVSRRRDPVLSMDLSVPPRASHNIDCNLPLDSGSDENQPVEMSEVLHNSLCSTSKVEDDMPSLPVQHTENGFPVRYGCDKGKGILDSPPLLTRNSSKNDYIQFFPESRTDSTLQLGNNSEKVSWLDPSNLIGLSLQPEQMVDGRACFPPSYEFPNIQVQSRESFHSHHPSSSDRTQSFARDKMMLECILTRARAVRGSRSTFLDKFEYPTTWLDEELDSLWIGVRRHGRGNWDAILGDRRLHFLPWKSPRDLAERWQVEQSRLLCSMPISQRRCMNPPNFSSEHMDEVFLSLGRSHTVRKGVVPLHYMNKKVKRDLSGGSRDEFSSTAGLIKGSLPHWLRTTAEIPSGPTTPAHTISFGWPLNHPSQQQQSWLLNQYISTQRRSEPENGRKASCSAGSPLVVECGKTQPDEHMVSKQEDLIMIPSDVSSEETISDDHNFRP